MELLRGINFGGYLSQCEHSLEHYKTFISEDDVRRVAEWGFDHIRLPIDYEVLEDENANENPRGIAFVDRMVKWCQDYNLDVVLDLHKAYGYDFNDAGNTDKNNLFTSESLKKRFVDLWSRLAKRYGGFENVAFELLNEVVEEENADLWNGLINETVQAIRVYAPETPIIYGGIQWNSARTLKLLDIPQDKNVIYTFHMYEPLIFTHQKAYWVPNMPMDTDILYPQSMEYYKEVSKLIGDKGKDVVVSKCEDIGKPFLIEMVKEAVDAANNAGVRLYCGEFGVIDRAPVEDTLRWFEDIMDVFKEYNIHCAVWSYKKMDFGISDEHYTPIAEKLIKLLTR
ncbi:MAG: glycoside hydrolase family 5 protein [Lachnospiraceae bacterium]